MTTESRLRDWRGGPVNAERLCADLLQILGYSDVDPQATLGGPDGKKDILARRDGRLYVAAVYFPPTSPSFAKIEAKYVTDRRGVDGNDADGFLFFVNQHLSLGQRRDLLRQGTVVDEIFHLERIRSILDSPRGYGLRLEYLNRKMSTEEQVAFFSTLRHSHLQELIDNDDLVPRIAAEAAPIANLNFSLLQLLHRAMLTNDRLLGQVTGRLRTMHTQVRNGAGDVIYTPPRPEDVPRVLAELFIWWRNSYALALSVGDTKQVVQSLAKLHYGIVAPLPFLDANDRLARLITDQAARELIRRRVSFDLIADRDIYFSALHAAQGGSMHELEEFIWTALE
ncbi:Fic family protein [Amycolatopsis sp. NPDC006125]|uniref:Fic family protein n=1 Tax=Amycolatopsis sp. NPDC006125 TaxID=3156730 RepID=UPI0033A040FC